MKTSIIWLFKQPLFRHVIAGLLIYYLVSSPYKGEIKRLNDENKYVIEVMAEITKTPKYSIENRIDGIRKKANVTLIPDNEITHIGDNEIVPEPEPKKKRKGLFGWLKKKP